MNEEELNIEMNLEEDLNFEFEAPVPQNEILQKQKDEARTLSQLMRESGNVPEPIIVTEEGTVKKASDLTIKEQANEIIRCTQNPIYFIETYLTIFDQTIGLAGEIVPFKLFDFQKELIETYLGNRFVVANKYRQAGISTTTCAYISWYIMFRDNRSVAIVADKLETARDELMKDVVDFIDGCPEWLRPKPDGKDTQKLKIYDNNSKLGAFSSKGLRGYTPTLLFWDETAWTEKGDKFWTAAGPTLQTGGRAIFVSTPSGLDPVFYKTFDAARRNESPFVAVELWWFNDPRYNDGLNWTKNKNKENQLTLQDENWTNEHRIKLQDDGWVASSPWFEEQVKQANGNMRKIAQELLCSFLGSGDNFIAEEYLKDIEENTIKPPIRQEYVDSNMWIWEDPLPDEDYEMTIDVSAGHGDDYSTINILKIKTIIENTVIKNKNGSTKKTKVKRQKTEQVAEYYGKLSPQQLGEIAYQYGKRYNNAYTVIDITGGYGIYTVTKLFEMGYEDIHYSEVSHKPSRDRLQGFIKKGQKLLGDGSMINVDLIPGFFIGNNRASVLLEMQRAIHMHDITIRSVRTLGELKTFITVPGNRVADHKRSFHDDSIMGIACGLFVITFDIDRFKENKTGSKKMLDAILLINDPEALEKKRLEEEHALKKSNPDDNSKKELKDRLPKHINPDMNPYIAHNWLFDGLKRN